MLIKFPNGNILHCRPDTGRGFIEANLAIEVIPERKKTIPKEEWLAIRGPVNSGIEDIPLIFFHCKGCGHKEYAKGPTIHKTLQVRHCGIVATPPSHIQEEYKRLRKMHDQALKDNARKAEQKAKFKLAEQSVLAAARD